MKTYNVEQKSLEWHELRRGKVTGTGLKKILGTPAARSKYLMEILAERLSVDDGNQDESPMDRGTRLEYIALEAFEMATGKIVTQVGLCESDDSPLIASSPDGLIENDGKFTEAVEIKCLSSASHLEAVLDNKVPKDHYPQAIQYFIVNQDLEKLYFILFDPRVTIKPMHIIELERETIKKDIEEYRTKEVEFIKEVEGKLQQLVTF